MSIKRDALGNQVQAMHPRVGFVQNLAVGAGSVSSVAFLNEGINNPQGANFVNFDETGQFRKRITQFVRLCSTVDCYVLFGPSPTVVTATTGLFLPAGSAEYFWVQPSDLVSVIQSVGAGNLNVSEMQ